MRAKLIAKTEFLPDDYETSGWETDASGAEALIEYAGRECYQSFHKPNPETQSNYDYITKSILSHQHFSVIEHSQATFRFTSIPRSLTHEFIRHRHFSYSELSQRYVNMADAILIDHPLFRDLTGEAKDEALNTMRDVRTDIGIYYDRLCDILKEAGYKGKKVRQAARQVMTESTETRIVVTGNLRTWRHFVNLRGNVHADDAIRELAVDVLRELQNEFPAVFSDYEIKVLASGETVAEGKYHDVS